MEIRIKHVRDEPAGDDGYRVLVDRLWPRGVSKERARLDEWAKDAGPSTELRRWFAHDPAKFEEFARRFAAELNGTDALAHLLAVVREHEVVTLLFDAHDAEHSNAVVLADALTRAASGKLEP